MKNYTDEQMREELKRREIADKPRLLTVINTTPLLELCQSYIDDLCENGHEPNKIEHWIYEAAVEMAFGEDVWSWIKKQITRMR